jgi:hypothetical protein
MRTIAEQDMNCWSGLCHSNFSSKFIFADLLVISTVGISDRSKCEDFLILDVRFMGTVGNDVLPFPLHSSGCENVCLTFSTGGDQFAH